MAVVRKNKGMTLIEIIIATLIIGILVMIAIPRYNKAAFKAKVMSYAAPKLKRIVEGMQAHILKTDGYYSINVIPATPVDWEVLGLDVPNDNKYNYGFDANPTVFKIIAALGAPAAYAIPYPFTTEALGNASFYEVGVSIDGKMGIVYSNGTFESW